MSGAYRAKGRATAGAGALVALALIASMSTARDRTPLLRPTPLAATAEAARPQWSPIQAALLVDEINAARSEGLDPQDYGVAALKGEIALAGEIRRGAGSRQLDALADAAARALARDRLRKVGAPNLSAEVQAAEDQNGPAVWLGVLRAQRRSAMPAA